MIRIRFPKDKVLPKYYWNFARTEKYWKQAKKLVTGGGQPQFNGNVLKLITFPLPPLEIQRQLVDEIAAHQRIIDGARQVVEGWDANLEVELAECLPVGMDEWKTVKLGDVCLVQDGTHFSPENGETGEYKYITAKNIKPFYIDLSNLTYISKEAHKSIYARCPVEKGDILYIKDGATAGIAAINTLDEEFSILSSVALMKPHKDVLDNFFLLHYLNSKAGKKNFLSQVGGIAITRLTLVKLKNTVIPLPPLEIQREIVARIETERAIVHGNRELIRLYEEKVKKVIERVWQ